MVLVGCLGAVALGYVWRWDGAVSHSSPTSPEHAHALAGTLSLAGSSTVAPLVSEMARRFQTWHPAVRIDVQMGGSSRGIRAARQGTVDIGMASRALTQDDGDLLEFAIARDGICLLVHRDNPVQGLTDKHIVDMYTGQITNWQEVGGQDAPIMVITREEWHSELELFTHYFQLKATAIKAQVTAGANQSGIKAVADNPDAIIYMSVGEAERSAASGMPIRLLPMRGIAATSHNVRTGHFPLVRPLTLVTPSLPSGIAKAFIAFALSSHVTDIIEKHNFIAYLD